MRWESQSEMCVGLSPTSSFPSPASFTLSLTAVSLYQQTNHSLISLATSQVPAIKYTVSPKCKLTAADEWPCGLRLESEPAERRGVSTVSTPVLLEGRLNLCTAGLGGVLNVDG